MSKIYIPADSSNPGYDVFGDALLNPGGTCSNGFEGKFLFPSPGVDMEEFGMVARIKLTYGTISEYIPLTSITNQRPGWSGEIDGNPVQIANASGQWNISIVGEGSSSQINTDTFPPPTSWPNIAGNSVSLEYESLFIENGEYINFDDIDLADHLNITKNVVLKWNNDTEVCVVQQMLIYPQGTVVDPSFYNKANKWAGPSGCGTPSEPYLLADGSEYLLDDGSVYLVEAS